MLSKTDSYASRPPSLRARLPSDGELGMMARWPLNWMSSLASVPTDNLSVCGLIDDALRLDSEILDVDAYNDNDGSGILAAALSPLPHKHRNGTIFSRGFLQIGSTFLRVSRHSCIVFLSRVCTLLSK